MGDYTTVTKVYELFPKLEDEGLSDKQIEFYITQAENEIKGKLGSIYSLPFTTTPPLVESMATEYSFIKLLERFYTGEAPSQDNWWKNRRTTLMKLLGSVCSGTISLVDSAQTIIARDSTPEGISSDTQGYESTFTHMDPTRERIDPDRIEDESDDRGGGFSILT